MSEGGDQEGDTGSLPDVLGDAEACKGLNQEDLLNRVRKMNEELEARIPLHHIPVALVVENITREKIAASWFRLCQDGGRPSIGRHIRRVVRSTAPQDSPATTMTLGNSTTQPSFFGDTDPQQQLRRALTWESEYPRSRYRGGLFKPPLFDDEPSDSDDDESHQGSSLAAIRK